jgi:hypothetical protein
MTVRGKPFRKGHDPRRRQFTTAERRRGFERTFNRAMYEAPWLLLWLRKKLRATCRGRMRHAG